MNQIILPKPYTFYFSRLLEVNSILRDFYLEGSLYVNIYQLIEPLSIQKILGYPETEFALLAGKRKNFVFKTFLIPEVVIPAYGYNPPLEETVEKEVLKLRETHNTDKKVAVYFKHDFKGFF